MKMKSIIFLMCSLFILVSCSKSVSVERSISSIYVYHCSESSIPFEEYKIDFISKEFTIIVKGGFIGMPNEVKEGSPVVKTLDANAISNFQRTAQENRFEDWKESYVNYNIKDGHQWGINISYSDGTMKEINGSNAYPETWDKMYDTFENLTGENVLYQKSDWLEIN